MIHPDSPAPEPPFTGDMPPEEFRAHAHHLVDWMADYLRDVGGYPVLSRVEPGAIRAALPPHVPEEGEPFDVMFRDFQEILLPGITHWNHPSFHGYFANTGSGPGILGEMLAAALNVNAMVWRSSPAGTELEIHTLEWIRELLGLPEGFEGTINDTASHSSLYALAAAREAAWPGTAEKGVFALRAGRIYLSTEAHSSIDKAGMTLGFGRTEGFRRVETDADLRMRPEALRRALEEDRAAGIRPVAVVATLGTTSTTAVDPVEEIAELASSFGAWLHVDAAYAGVAASVEEFRKHFRGWELADSIVVNPHKWLFTPMDCSLLYCRRPSLLRAAFALTPEYLKGGEGEVARNLMDSGVALGRRFRALKLWFVLRWFGAEGIRARIREHVRLARRFEGWVRAEPGWEVSAPVPFSLVVFRFAPRGTSGEGRDDLNLAILERLNAGGEAFLTHTRLHGRVVLRLSVGNLRTREEHLARTWELLREAAREV
jgi:aromatic-L-amino-acid/L-tryptophan decarboxylase